MENMWAGFGPEKGIETAAPAFAADGAFGRAAFEHLGRYHTSLCEVLRGCFVTHWMAAHGVNGDGGSVELEFGKQRGSALSSLQFSAQTPRRTLKLASVTHARRLCSVCQFWTPVHSSRSY